MEMRLVSANVIRPPAYFSIKALRFSPLSSSYTPGRSTAPPIETFRSILFSTILSPALRYGFCEKSPSLTALNKSQVFRSPEDEIIVISLEDEYFVFKGSINSASRLKAHAFSSEASFTSPVMLTRKTAGAVKENCTPESG